MLRDNIDTDQIIPSREMKTVSKTGLKDGLFAGQRYVSGREVNPEFVLNKMPYKNATILLSGKNFGCGSSREHAVWALKDFGIRAIIAESFGEIFYNNCIRNGILAAQMDGSAIRTLGQNVTIDLAYQQINGLAFYIPNGDKVTLMEGLDAIAVTQKQKTEIDAFFIKDKHRFGWKYS